MMSIRGRKTRKVNFQINAAEGSDVFLAGSFNNWDPKANAMKYNGEGCCVANISLAPGRYEYKFLVNGDWQTDESCKQWATNSFGSLNSVVEVT